MLTPAKMAIRLFLPIPVALADGAELKQTYRIPEKGYEIGYSISSRGLAKELGEQLSFQWNNLLRPVEKDIADNRNNTTINYYQNGKVDWLPERSGRNRKRNICRWSSMGFPLSRNSSFVHSLPTVDLQTEKWRHR
jgi:hypothetical protein